MTNRRTFLKSGALSAGAAAAITSQAIAAPEQRKNASVVGGYQLPAFKEGSRLLFQGDSITDMKWGRNQKDRNHYLGHSYGIVLLNPFVLPSGRLKDEAQWNIWRGEVDRSMSGKIGKRYVLSYSTPKDDAKHDSIEISGESYPLIQRSPNEFEYTEILEVPNG